MISVFTPIHRLESESLKSLCESLANQTNKNFEWIILLNGPILLHGNKISLNRLHDIVEGYGLNARILTSAFKNNIGALKAECCEYAVGDILVEVDYDDLLTENALEVIQSTFDTRPETKFFYSNCWEFLPDGTTNELYGSYYGWKHKPYQEDKMQNVSFPALPQYLRRIEWSPNHVRALRASAYEQVGGYDKAIEVGDDHDLMCRFYLTFGETAFYHYDDVLYHYRVHDGNTSGKNGRNEEVQIQVDVNYQKHAEKMFLKWADDNELMKLDLGGRFDCPEGYISVDLLDADIVMDLAMDWKEIADDSVGVLRAYHILEHLPDSIHFFNEAYRVLAPGGLLLIEVPSSNGMAAFSDPTHISFYNQLSFEYFTNESYGKYVRPQLKAKFQKSRVVEYNWQTPFGNVPIVSAQLLCLKGWYEEEWCGEKQM